MDSAETMAEWELPKCANMEMNRGPATDIWKEGMWRSSMVSGW